MHILIAGSSGFIGSALIDHFKSEGHKIRRLIRSKSCIKDSGESFWNPEAEIMDPGALDGIDAVINLAGENVASGRWTATKKRHIRDSRILSTKLLSEAIAAVQNPPKVLINASAIGYYGPEFRDVTEESAPGNSFLADVCVEWEAATNSAKMVGTRVVQPRIGVVLHPSGGALKRMIFPFRLGLGGVLGSGKQPFSWIALQDVVGGIEHCLTHEEIQGPVNFTAPNPITNRAFTKALGKVLSRPTILPVPAFIARLAFGEFADEALLAGVFAYPRILEKSGYRFQCKKIEEGLSLVR